MEAARAHREYLTGETLAVRLKLGPRGDELGAGDYAEESDIEGRALGIALRRA